MQNVIVNAFCYPTISVSNPSGYNFFVSHLEYHWSAKSVFFIIIMWLICLFKSLSRTKIVKSMHGFSASLQHISCKIYIYEIRHMDTKYTVTSTLGNYEMIWYFQRTSCWTSRQQKNTKLMYIAHHVLCSTSLDHTLEKKKFL